MAWLNATPRPDNPPEKGGAKPPDISRADQLKKDGVSPKMPHNPAPHIIDRLVEIGLTEAGGIGAAPLSWREITAWQVATSIALPPWEARLIRKLSVEYLAESSRAKSEACPPPWTAPATVHDRKTEEMLLRNFMRQARGG